ncbi:MAG TPA: hypothetical protein PKA77_02805 [Chitinophagaceae bacterium]|jgi:hypothetical protein|nr:hypothetical protein [Chitinophagaceae bacterium]HMU57000.1 hypothetical protein [Chitinophagaceae bacterium]
MRKTIIAVALLVIAEIGTGQVYIQTTLPTTGLVQQNQLWNLILINGGVSTLEAKLILLLKDRQTGLELFTATTKSFTINKGSLPLSVNNLNPVQYNYLATDATSLYNGLLPAGAYTACYSLIRMLGEKQEPLTEECIHFDVEPLSPPMLIFPADSAELETIPVQFTWTPPVPAGMVKQLRYDFMIAELLPGQKAAEAVQHNLPFYSSTGVINNFLTCPASLPAFDKEKWYSWQVVARDDNSYAGKSEVWVFKAKKESQLELIIKGTPYIRMKPENPEAGIAPNGILKLAYFNRSADTTAVIVFHDISGEEHPRERPSVSVPVIAGENQLQVSLRKVIALSEEKTYCAEITSSSGERSSVLFRVKQFEDK